MPRDLSCLSRRQFAHFRKGTCPSVYLSTSYVQQQRASCFSYWGVVICNLQVRSGQRKSGPRVFAIICSYSLFSMERMVSGSLDHRYIAWNLRRFAVLSANGFVHLGQGDFIVDSELCWLRISYSRDTCVYVFFETASGFCLLLRVIKEEPRPLLQNRNKSTAGRMTITRKSTASPLSNPA